MTRQLALHLAITVPFAAGALAFIIPRRAGLLARVIALLVSVLVLWASVEFYRLPATPEPHTLLAWPDWAGTGWAGRPMLALDGLSGLTLLGVGFFSLLMTVYSLGIMKGEAVRNSYWGNLLWVMGSACATVLARDLIVLTFFWALMSIPFFLLINQGSGNAGDAAKKTLIVLGGSDALMILGIGLIYHLSGSFDLLQQPVSLAGMGTVACLCMAAAAFAKAGAMPLHSWVPDAAESSPVAVVALLPASLDKLLGIYLFTRISLSLFDITPAIRGLFVIIGAVTVMAAVMAALVQHNLRRLLGFHAVSQVGYMVLGIATGTAVGIVGGLFHMFNNALYKSCLFLAAGAAERRAGTGELDAMGGLARSMPVTFGAALVAALAISGVPPLNGFVSKWMVYQGIIQMGGQGGWLWIVALVAAMFGSALTLASFVKVLHSVFLGQPRPGQRADGPAPNALMGLPMVVLAAACVVFGVAAYAVPVSGLLLPALPQVQADFAKGFVNPAWQPGIATLLLCAALAVGLLTYFLGRVGIREDDAYIGGEAGERAQAYRFSGVEFYGTVAELAPLRTFYSHAAQGWYDVYHLGRRAVSYAGGILRAFHSGVLLTYVAWFVLGMAVLMWVFLGKWFAQAAVSP